MKLLLNTLPRLLVVLAIISSLVVSPVFCQDSEDSQIFIAGFNAYQQKDYTSAIEKMNEVLKKYPDTPLRDMALFWLSRSYFKTGNQQEAARFLSQFSKEYPDNPLRGTVEDELLALATRYDKGERLPTGGTPPRQQVAQQVVQKSEETKKATAAAEAARIAAQKQAEEKAAADKREQDQIASRKAEEMRKAAAEAEKKEQQRLVVLKTEDMRKSAALEKERAEAEQAARVRAEQERQVASIKAETAKQLTAAEAARAEELKKAEEKAAAEKKEQERLAVVKVAEAKKTADAEATRVAAQKQAEEKAAAEKKEQERLAALKAEDANAKKVAAVEKKEQERLAAQKAEEAEAERIASLKRTEEKAAVEKKDQEPVAAVKVAKAGETRRPAVQQRGAADKKRTGRNTMREKAIAQYKMIIEKYPASPAANSAAAKLRELGIAVALPKYSGIETLPENAQVLRLVVAQYAGFEFNLLARSEAYNVARRISIPFEVINRGNGNDSFTLYSSFPAEFRARFYAATAPDSAITQTPVLARGETFRGTVDLVIPATSIDGLRLTYPIKVASRLMAEASQSREVRLVASAPLLRAVLKTDKSSPLPGEKIVYRVAVLNIGSTAAQNVTFRLSYPPQLEPVDYGAAGLRQESKSALVFDGLQVNSGQSREFSVAFQLKADSLAQQELSTRAELINNELKTTAAFVSNVISVQSQRGIAVRTGSDRQVVIPGQTITVPFIVTNTGNIREKFRVSSRVEGAQDAILFHDINRDGIRQASEPVIREIGPLAPKEEASVVVEIKTPRSAGDGSDGRVTVSFVSEGESTRSASGTTRLLYSRPVLQMAMVGQDGRLKPGDIASFDLTITNRGSNLARIVELQSVWPDQLELVAADPSNSTFTNGAVIWKFKELGAGEKRNIKVSFRVKQGTGVGTAIQVKNILGYEDQLGNRY
ncbi:MAG TPA: tetratricopeptide repeat protein [Desulfuromonadales bacterium]|nr:tetratricopeptide repeat protein [Desulfuromonadales bacterium]